MLGMMDTLSLGTYGKKSREHTEPGKQLQEEKRALHL